MGFNPRTVQRGNRRRVATAQPGPTSPSVGDKHTTLAGAVFEYFAAGGWGLVQETTFSVNNFTNSNAIDTANDGLLWFDQSIQTHRRISLSDLATLLGTTATGGGSGVGLV